jgi:glycolate oxidase iron-sulfur subunit
VRFVEPERLSTCVHCGLCLASCPTYVELGTEADSPRGRIYLMKELEEGRLAPSAEVIAHLDGCLGCRACETACPSGVAYGSLIEAVRPWVAPQRPAATRVTRHLLGTLLSGGRLGRLARTPLRVASRLPGIGRLARRAPGHWVAYAAALPRRRPRAALPRVLEPAGRPRGTAVLLAGCVAEDFFPETNRATALLLQRAGVRVVLAPQAICCGALALHLGLGGRARRLARRTAGVLAGLAADWVVSNAAGCGAHLRGYAHLLEGEAMATAVAGRARDALDLLAELGLPPAPGPLERTIAVHDPCHLAHGQGVREPVRRLLAAIPRARLVPLGESDWCCGSAGTYNLTAPAMARRLLERKLDHVAASGAQMVAAANPGCLLQIRAGVIARGLDVAVEHPIDLLARAHGLVAGS